MCESVELSFGDFCWANCGSIGGREYCGGKTGRTNVLYCCMVVFFQQAGLPSDALLLVPGWR